MESKALDFTFGAFLNSSYYSLGLFENLFNSMLLYSGVSTVLSRSIRGLREVFPKEGYPPIFVLKTEKPIHLLIIFVL